MPPTPAKAREIELREATILGVARRLLLDRGYLGMTMDRIAEHLDFSKGTLYGHFGSKEDVLCALALESERKRAEFFERAASFEGSPRERMTAITAAHELYFRLHPTYFRSEQLIHSQELLAKIDPERRAEVVHCGLRCHQLMTDVIEDAARQKQLALPRSLTPSALAFLLWSFTSGAYSHLADPAHLQQIGVSNPVEAVRHACQTFLDGVGWKPLSTQHDYAKTVRQVLTRCFPEEMAEVMLTSSA